MTRAAAVVGGLAIVGGLALLGGCPFAAPPASAPDRCIERFVLVEGASLRFAGPDDAASWAIQATFTGVGQESGVNGQGHAFEASFSMVAVAGDSDVETATADLRLVAAGSGLLLVSEPLEQEVGAPRQGQRIDVNLTDALIGECDGQETCTLDFELTVESQTEALYFFDDFFVNLRGNLGPPPDAGCGVSEHDVADGPSPDPLGGSDSGSGSGSGGDSGSDSGSGG